MIDQLSKIGSHKTLDSSELAQVIELVLSKYLMNYTETYSVPETRGRI